MHTKHLSAELPVIATQALKPSLKQACVKKSPEAAAEIRRVQQRLHGLEKAMEKWHTAYS